MVQGEGEEAAVVVDFAAAVSPCDVKVTVEGTALGVHKEAGLFGEGVEGDGLGAVNEGVDVEEEEEGEDEEEEQEGDAAGEVEGGGTSWVRFS